MHHRPAVFAEPAAWLPWNYREILGSAQVQPPLRDPPPVLGQPNCLGVSVPQQDLKLARRESLAGATAFAIPATPVMTVYRFDGALDVPYYAIDEFARRGTRAKPAGSLAQGTSVVPCLVIRDGMPVQ